MFGFLNRKKYDKKVIIYVGRKDNLVPMLTKGRRFRDIDGSIAYELIDPTKPKVKYKMDDIPTDYINSNGVIEVYTLDFQQFTPCKTILGKKDQITIDTLSSEQKVWYAKSVREDYLRVHKKSGWDEHKTLIFTVIILLAILVIVWIVMTNLTAQANALGSPIRSLDFSISKLTSLINASNAGGRPPI